MTLDEIADSPAASWEEVDKAIKYLRGPSRSGSPTGIEVVSGLLMLVMELRDENLRLYKMAYLTIPIPKFLQRKKKA